MNAKTYSAPPQSKQLKSHSGLCPSERPGFPGEAQFSLSGLNIAPHCLLINELKRQVTYFITHTLLIQKGKV